MSTTLFLSQIDTHGKIHCPYIETHNRSSKGAILPLEEVSAGARFIGAFLQGDNLDKLWVIMASVKVSVQKSFWT